MEPYEVDRMVENAMVYHDGIKVNGHFYTFVEWDDHVKDLLDG